MVTAGGNVTIDLINEVPTGIVDKIKNHMSWYGAGLECEIEFDGNWRLADVIDTLEPLNPYIKNAQLSYWSDEGEALATFHDGYWDDEWEEKYYPSDLPNEAISDNKRIKEILNIIAENLMACSDSEPAVELLLNKCKLTNKEIHYYGLEWLKDLKSRILLHPGN